MKRLENILAALTPKRWPVRWRLAAVSATLTLVILVDLRRGRRPADVRTGSTTTSTTTCADTAATIAGQTQVGIDPSGAQGPPRPQTPARWPSAGRNSAVIGSSIRTASRFAMATLGSLRTSGPPDVGSIKQRRRLRGGLVSTRCHDPDAPTRSIVQYARSTDSLDATINRLWLFLGVRRAGRHRCSPRWPGSRSPGGRCGRSPTLTATAREIASTRDPSLRIPEPETDDEVGELARTLEQMLRELDAARSETEQMMQAQREFVADASHELRTPLTSILANLELLQDRLDAAERRGEEGEMVDSALRSSRRMSRLVSDLLLLARADAGRTGARRECDLAEVAAAALSEVRPVANGHRLTLADDGPVPVEGNPDELHRLARQPARQRPAPHARGHRDPGRGRAPQRRRGARGLRRRPRAPARHGGAGLLAVRARARARPTSPATRGTGLGLAIVKAVATSHGGDVDAGSSPRRRGAVHGPAAAAAEDLRDEPGHAKNPVAVRTFRNPFTRSLYFPLGRDNPPVGDTPRHHLDG